MTTPSIPSSLAEALESELRPQNSFPWTRESWSKQCHDLPEVLSLLERLPERVSRETTLATATEELDAGRVLPAFVAVMVWGWGPGGLGALRTRWILTQTTDTSADVTSLPIDPVVAVKLEAAAKSVRNDGARDAFYLMNNEGALRNLGPSYFTKWLYFCSAVDGADSSDAAPIFDKQIVGWLKSAAEVSLDRTKTPSYERYLVILEEWGRPYGRTRAQVETEIFRLATGRG